MKNISENAIEHIKKKREWILFLFLALCIIGLTGFNIKTNMNHERDIVAIKNQEIKTIIYLDNELCQRIRYLESISVGYTALKIEPGSCDAYIKLEAKRLLNE